MKNTEIYLNDWYSENYPEDIYGACINTTATFAGLYRAVEQRKDVYAYIGAGDSLIRERLFKKLAELFGNGIYDMWLAWA